jgi:UDP-GlcNAc3NAcA epimerase
MKVLTVVGARPQFVKAALVSEALTMLGTIEEIVVHTGQHYDVRMSNVFFEQLGMAQPRHQLNVGSGSHGRQSGAMLAKLDDVLEIESPELVLVYGDTNSTLAGALSAAKMHIPVAHVEAGLRSFNRQMPEEINRIVADVVSTMLLCPTQTAVQQLCREGITQGVHLVGDVMLDMLERALPVARSLNTLGRFRVQPREFYLATIHRAENTDDRHRLSALLETLDELDRPVLMPVHPRTRAALHHADWTPRAGGNLRQIEPVGYLEMLALEDGARAVLTDSGGVQKEAFFLSRPCITLRGETEWTETLVHGWNQVTGASRDGIMAALDRLPIGVADTSPFGNGHAAEAIADILRTVDHECAS